MYILIQQNVSINPFLMDKNVIRYELEDKMCCISKLQNVGWLVVLRINVDLAIFQPYLDFEAGDNQSLKMQVARPGIEPRSTCSASQELNHSATAASLENVKSNLTQINIRESVWDLLLNVTCKDISVIYVTAHRCAGGLKKFDLQSGSHRHFVWLFNLPVQAPTPGLPFYTVIPRKRPLCPRLRHAEDTEDAFST